MSNKAKAVILGLVILLVIVVGTYLTVSSEYTEPDSEEFVARLQTISEQIIEKNKGTELQSITKITTIEDEGTTITLTYNVGKSITVTVSASLTIITINLDQNWNIISESVTDLHKDYFQYIVGFGLAFLLSGILVFMLVAGILGWIH